MILDEEFVSLSVDPLEGVGAISVHTSESVGCAAIRHQNGHLMESLRGVAPEVPSHVGVLNTGSWVSLLTVDEVRELDGVLNEENGRVVSNHIVVAFFGVMFDGETTGVAIAVIGATFTGDGGEAEEDGSSLADGVHEGGLAEWSHIFGDLTVAVSTGTLSMDNSLWDSLTGKVSKFIEEVEVLSEDGTTGSGCHGVLVVVDRVSR